MEPVTRFSDRLWWAPRDGGWWVAFPFSVGSVLFILGAVMPALEFIPDSVTTVTFFLGSSLYLLGATAQVVGEFIRSRRARRLAGGDRADTAPDTGLHRTAVALSGGVVQGVGAVLFQTNLTAAFAQDLTIAQQEVLLWAPDLVGSVLFLVSSSIFFRLNRPIQGREEEGQDRTLALLNMVGSSFFILSALGAYVSPISGSEIYPFVANLGTLIGAGFFLVSSIPGLPHARIYRTTRAQARGSATPT